MKEIRILIVDDEKSIVKMLETVLRKEGFQLIDKAYNTKEALTILNKHKVDMIILDVMLPDQSGFDVLPNIRELSEAYVLFLTARVSDLDVLTGFAIGGDDYVTKPFNPLEVVARLKAYIRRSTKLTNLQVKQSTNKYDYGRFTLFSESGELFV